MIEVTPVVLCGGSGTRLWPLSRTGLPKQFVCLTGEDSLFQQAAKRLAALEGENIKVAAPLIVAGEAHRFLVSEQLREVGISFSAALLEPMGRDTAPALALAALAAIENGADPVLVVTPADQTVGDGVAFNTAMQTAVEQAVHGGIVVLGVFPSTPETGYGYIQVDADTSQKTPNGIDIVKRFVEKPNVVNAENYLNEGDYFWNAGIFVLKASVWLLALEQFRPDIYKTTVEAWRRRSTNATSSIPFVRLGQEEFTAIPSESIDYAVIERCSGSSFPIYMVRLDAGWSDVGCWSAVWDLLPKDESGNAYVGDVLNIQSRNTLVHARGRLVSLLGVEDLVVVETPDAVLVADKSMVQNVKHIVNQLQNSKREEHVSHRKVYRPWGWYDCIDQGSRFKVKHIHVKPKASLSLQKHYYRAEHWVVVSGTAEITNGDKVQTLIENQSTFIPRGEVHRISNPGTMPLEIIEVQSGSYLGEDDIVRFEDVYGRTSS